MRHFRLRRLWRVNCEALKRVAGQNLKQLLKKRYWGRRPYPAEAVFDPLFGWYWWIGLSYVSICVSSPIIRSPSLLSKRTSILSF